MVELMLVKERERCVGKRSPHAWRVAYFLTSTREPRRKEKVAVRRPGGRFNVDPRKVQRPYLCRVCRAERATPEAR